MAKFVIASAQFRLGPGPDNPGSPASDIHIVGYYAPAFVLNHRDEAKRRPLCKTKTKGSAAKGNTKAGALMTPARHSTPLVLLLLALQAGNEHLLGPLGSLQVVLKHGVEEFHELLVTLRLGVLNVGLQGLYVVRGLVEHGDEVVVLVLGLSC